MPQQNPRPGHRLRRTPARADHLTQPPFSCEDSRTGTGDRPDRDAGAASPRQPCRPQRGDLTRARPMVIISAPINIATADPKARRRQYHRREPVAFNQKRRRISVMAAASLSAFPLLTCLRIKRCQLWAGARSSSHGGSRLLTLSFQQLLPQ